jgi:hypothetical protein
MTELASRHFWRSATIEEQRCVGVSESMESGTLNFQGIEQRIEMVLDDLLRGVRAAVAVAEQ